MSLPVLYSYRRCPYAMRARLAILQAGMRVELREILLRDKPADLLLASPKGTVPVLVLGDGRVLEQSREIMLHALQQCDPDDWLCIGDDDLQARWAALIDANDGDFKNLLDRYKYPERHPDLTQAEWRGHGETFLTELETRLARHDFLLRPSPCIADIALFPFVRQFAAVDAAWFEQAQYPRLRRWLRHFSEAAAFERVMRKAPVWRPGTPGESFPA